MRFSGPYADWAEAAREGSYDEASILARVLEATTLALHTGQREQDGSVRPIEESVSPALAAIMMAAAAEHGSLSVLDFGGALGSHWLAWQAWLGLLPAYSWHVVEQASFAAAGRELFAGSADLHFHDSVNAVCRAGVEINAVLASAVLPYLQNPHDCLSELLSVGAQFVVVDRMPFIDGMQDLIVVQKNPRNIGGHRYPCWLFSEEALIATARAAGYRPVLNWTGSDGQFQAGSRHIQYRGLILRRQESTR